MYEPGRLHFAVASSGKSPFVVPIRRLDAQHQEAAEIGVIKKTVEIGRLNSDLPFVWCDVLRSGTLQQPDWLHLSSARRVSSCLIASFVLFNDRFTQMDVVILMSCMRFQIPTYILRSKVDVHIRNIPYKNGFDSDREDATARESLFPSACGRFIADT
ncbi:hypothetical protein EDD15DRAFT_719732 [Pisolithus albus]|nr:hypothetical protein EDD15DRAFT_719732 [Pisolithus albus]